MIGWFVELVLGRPRVREVHYSVTGRVSVRVWPPLFVDRGDVVRRDDGDKWRVEQVLDGAIWFSGSARPKVGDSLRKTCE
jgi:hypothetical protein